MNSILKITLLILVSLAIGLMSWGVSSTIFNILVKEVIVETVKKECLK